MIRCISHNYVVYIHSYTYVVWMILFLNNKHILVYYFLTMYVFSNLRFMGYEKNV